MVLELLRELSTSKVIRLVKHFLNPNPLKRGNNLGGATRKFALLFKEGGEVTLIISIAPTNVAQNYLKGKNPQPDKLPYQIEDLIYCKKSVTPFFCILYGVVCIHHHHVLVRNFHHD
jgi:hypothetical protein